MNNINLPIFHAFNPLHKFIPHKYGEVRFVKGKYIDIVNSKGKDIHSLYFGTSNNTKLLTGIFLGDYELTSKVKDISIVSKDKNIILSVKYINDDGKLATIKSTLPSSSSQQDIEETIKEFQEHLNIIDTSINDIYDKINVLDSSVFIIENKLDIIDTSINEITNDLENGKYNYTLRETLTTLEDGCKKIYTLFKGDNEQTDSSSIILMDYVLKQLEYNNETNTLIASVWPDSCGDDIYYWTQEIDSSGNNIMVKKTDLNNDYIKTITLNLDSLETHIINNINTNSVINDRITTVETQLKWDELFN